MSGNKMECFEILSILYNMTLEKKLSWSLLSNNCIVSENIRNINFEIEKTNNYYSLFVKLINKPLVERVGSWSEEGPDETLNSYPSISKEEFLASLKPEQKHDSRVGFEYCDQIFKSAAQQDNDPDFELNISWFELVSKSLDLLKNTFNLKSQENSP